MADQSVQEKVELTEDQKEIQALKARIGKMVGVVEDEYRHYPPGSTHRANLIRIRRAIKDHADGVKPVTIMLKTGHEVDPRDQALLDG